MWHSYPRRHLEPCASPYSLTDERAGQARHQKAKPGRAVTALRWRHRETWGNGTQRLAEILWEEDPNRTTLGTLCGKVSEMCTAQHQVNNVFFLLLLASAFLSVTAFKSKNFKTVIAEASESFRIGALCLQRAASKYAPDKAFHLGRCSILFPGESSQFMPSTSE